MKTKKNISNGQRTEKEGNKSWVVLMYHGKENDIPLKNGQKNHTLLSVFTNIQMWFFRLSLGNEKKHIMHT